MKRFFSGLICLSFYLTLAAQSSIYTPSTLIGSIPLKYDVFPPAGAGNDDLAAWLRTVAEKDMSQLHYTALPDAPRVQEIKGIQIYSVGVKDADGKQQLLNYMAYSRSDGQVRYGRIIETPIASVKSYMTTAVQHFMAIYKKEGGRPTASSPQKTRPQREETPVTAPGLGLKPADIRGFVIHQETGIGVGGMVIIIWRPYLLLKDGTMYSHCSVSPYDLDVPRSRQPGTKRSQEITTPSAVAATPLWEAARWSSLPAT